MSTSDGFADLKHSAEDGERTLEQVDEHFEMLLALYRCGPKTPEALQHFTIQVEALDRRRAYGEWKKWYYTKQLHDNVLAVCICSLNLPCLIAHKCCWGTWKGYDAWRANHPSPTNWNLDQRIATNEPP